MNVFLLDLWADLREKRLAPVALLLLAGIIAVPIVLAKSQKTPPPPPAATTTASAPAGPVVENQAQGVVVSSKLQTFSPRDPFAPTGNAAAATGTSTTTTTTATGTATGTTTTTTTGTSGTGTTGSGTTTPGGGTTGTQPSTGNGNTGTTTPQTKTTMFTYTVDMKFGASGDVKTFKDIKRLQLVPDDKNPKVVFLGVTTTGKTAVFLVDSNIGVDTSEGRCRPSPDECTFLYLRPDKDHDQATLTDSDGTVYHVRLLGINRVTVSSTTGSTTSPGNSNGNTNSNRSPAFTGNAKPSDQSVPGDTPPGEPAPRSSFQQFFADGSGSSNSGSGN